MSDLRKPNLFIIGAMKSGTSSLHQYLNNHPSIFMCEPKEPCYFVHPKQLNWPNMKKLGLWGNEEKYLRLFEDAGEATILGESSTLYAKEPHITDVAERIAKFNPEARFIYIMRDPIERTVSHYWHETRQGNENQSLLTAVQNNPLYQDVSNYPKQLNHYFQYFSPDQFLFLTFEELCNNAEACMTKTFEWLGVDASFAPENLSEKFHATPKQFYQKSALFRLRYTWPFNQLASLLPKKIRSSGLKLAVREVDRDKDAEDLQEAIQFLRPIQLKQTADLSNLLGMTFPDWKTLYDTKN